MNELEELVWRESGKYDEQDIDTLNKMFSINRNKDYFDRQYFDNDMKSMNEFISQSNNYDDRIKLLEEWVIRKEEEFKTRSVLPPDHMKKPDSDLN